MPGQQNTRFPCCRVGPQLGHDQSDSGVVGQIVIDTIGLGYAEIVSKEFKSVNRVIGKSSAGCMEVLF